MVWVQIFLMKKLAVNKGEDVDVNLEDIVAKRTNDIPKVHVIEALTK